MIILEGELGLYGGIKKFILVYTPALAARSQATRFLVVQQKHLSSELG